MTVPLYVTSRRAPETAIDGAEDAFAVFEEPVEVGLAVVIGEEPALAVLLYVVFTQTVDAQTSQVCVINEQVSSLAHFGHCGIDSGH